MTYSSIGSTVPTLEPSPLQSFAYDGRVRVLEIEFRVTACGANYKLAGFHAVSILIRFFHYKNMNEIGLGGTELTTL